MISMAAHDAMKVLHGNGVSAHHTGRECGGDVAEAQVRMGRNGRFGFGCSGDGAVSTSCRMQRLTCSRQGALRSRPSDIERWGQKVIILVGSSQLIASSGLGLSMFDSDALALEVNPSSPSAFSADILRHFVLLLGDLDPGTAQLATTFVGPLITVLNALFIFRIVMSWYPGIPVKKFPFFLAYNPTEPILGPTRRLIPPVGGVDVAPVIWVAIMSFANEVLLGKQGLLVLLSQQQP